MSSPAHNQPPETTSVAHLTSSADEILSDCASMPEPIIEARTSTLSVPTTPEPSVRPSYPLKPHDEHGIAWTTKTWNPMHGCTKYSMGCRNCYACGMAKRQQGMEHSGYENGFALTLRPERLDQPSTWKKPRLVFSVSMGDLFHADVPDSYIMQVVDKMRQSPRHRFQVLTKRAERLAAMQIDWPSNVWVGVSVEHSNYLHRVDCLRRVRATVRWLSLEPLLGSLAGIDLTGIDWVVVGGESGPSSRPIQVDWVREIRDICLRGQTAFFFKQWGGRKKRQAGRELDGRTWDEMPQDYGLWISMVAAQASAMSRKNGRLQLQSGNRASHRIPA